MAWRALRTNKEGVTVWNPFGHGSVAFTISSFGNNQHGITQRVASCHSTPRAFQGELIFVKNDELKFRVEADEARCSAAAVGLPADEAPGFPVEQGWPD